MTSMKKKPCKVAGLKGFVKKNQKKTPDLPNSRYGENWIGLRTDPWGTHMLERRKNLLTELEQFLGCTQALIGACNI